MEMLVGGEETTTTDSTNQAPRTGKFYRGLSNYTWLTPPSWIRSLFELMSATITFDDRGGSCALGSIGKVASWLFVRGNGRTVG